jgi:hypothetical protein
MALGAFIRQVMRFEPVTTLSAAHERSDLVEREGRVPQQATFLLYDVEAEPNMIRTMTGEGVATNLHELHLFGALSGGLFLDGLNDGADKMNFVHNWPFEWPQEYASGDGLGRNILWPGIAISWLAAGQVVLRSGDGALPVAGAGTALMDSFLPESLRKRSKKLMAS